MIERLTDHKYHQPFNTIFLQLEEWRYDSYISWNRIETSSTQDALPAWNKYENGILFQV